MMALAFNVARADGLEITCAWQPPFVDGLRVLAAQVSPSDRRHCRGVGLLGGLGESGASDVAQHCRHIHKRYIRFSRKPLNLLHDRQQLFALS